MGRVRLEGYLEVPPERVFQVATALPTHIALTRAEPGCVSFEVTQSQTIPEHFLVSEVFLDQAAFDYHQARAGASAWAEATVGLHRHYTITVEGEQERASGATAPSPPGDQQPSDSGGRIRFPVPDVVRRRAVSEGEAGLTWLATLDDVLTSLEQDWAVTIGPALPGGTAAYVAEASTETGDIVILKLSTPGTAAGRHEAEVLRRADGRGYARLLRHDPARHAMLLERLGDRLDSLDLPYERQVDIMCATLLQAWAPVPDDLACPTGADKANGLAQSILALWHGAGQPCAQAVIDTALMYCKDRAAAYRPESAVLAHGDPHPANIMALPDSDPVQFRFIDPDGLAIEPAYDLGVLLRAWHEGIEGRHAHDIARSHVRHLTRRTQVPSEPIWQWGYIERVSTGLHLLQIGQIAEGRAYLDVAEAITSTMG